MPRTNLWNHNLPRVEIDQRSREARLRFELIVRLSLLRAAATHTRLRRLIYLITVGRYGELPREDEVKDPQSNRWPSSLPLLLGFWLENGELVNAALLLIGPKKASRPDAKSPISSFRGPAVRTRYRDRISAQR